MSTEQTDQMTVPSEPAVETASAPAPAVEAPVAEKPVAEKPVAAKPAPKPRATRAAKAAAEAKTAEAAPAERPAASTPAAPAEKPAEAPAPAAPAEKPAETPGPAAPAAPADASPAAAYASSPAAPATTGVAPATEAAPSATGVAPATTITPPSDRPSGQPQEAPAADRPAGDGERPQQAAQGGGQQQGQQRQGKGKNRRGRDKRQGGGGGDQQRDDRPSIPCTGILDVLPDGFGFLRTNGFTQGDHDVYVSLSQIRRFGLRRGDLVAGQVREPKDNEKYNALLKIDGINGMDPDAARQRPVFEKLTPLYPEERLRLETEEHDTAARIMDLLCPIGKGQRGLVVSPPKAGKTTILKKLANSIATNNPEVDLFVLLVDERPEEVTDMQRSVIGTVVASTFDQPSENHVQITELVLDRVKRLVEMGHDVVVLLDSITRMARAFNLNTPASGRILSGGVDSTALYPPKKFFGAARNIEEGGSLTILATALVDTGSRMDEVIFEEFKGTGNMEIRLDRKLADKRIFPAIDIEATGTRKEELLMEAGEAATVWKLRSVLHSLDPSAAIELLIKKTRETKNNAEFLSALLKNSR